MESIIRQCGGFTFPSYRNKTKQTKKNVYMFSSSVSSSLNKRKSLVPTSSDYHKCGKGAVRNGIYLVKYAGLSFSF